MTYSHVLNALFTFMPPLALQLLHVLSVLFLLFVNHFRKITETMANSTKSKTICSVVNCTNTPANCERKVPKVTFHRFPSKPQDVDRKRLWVRFTKRQTIDGKDWQPKPWSLICSEHFYENTPVNNLQHRGYEPLYYKENVNSSQRMVITTKVPTDNCRFERYEMYSYQQ